MSKWTFDVETKESGQRRKYGDSYYHYIVKSKMHKSIIKDFCTRLLERAIPEKEYRESTKDGCEFGNHFQHYCTMLEFTKLENGEGQVEYKVVSPSTH